MPTYLNFSLLLRQLNYYVIEFSIYLKIYINEVHDIL